MPVVQYRATSPHLYRSARDIQHDAASQYRRRKSSLTKSLQAFAKQTFHRRSRHTNTGDSSHGTTPATSCTDGSCPDGLDVSRSRSEGLMASVTQPPGGSPGVVVASEEKTDAEKQISTGVTASPKAGQGSSGKEEGSHLQEPKEGKNHATYSGRASEGAETNTAKGRSVEYKGVGKDSALAQVSRIPIPSPQPSGYPRRRNTTAGLSLPKSTTFSSFSSLTQGVSVQRSQSPSKSIKGSCRHPSLQKQQQIGTLSRIPETANAQTAQTTSKLPTKLFGPRQSFSSQQKPSLVPRFRPLPKSKTAINLTSRSEPTGCPVLKEDSISCDNVRSVSNGCTEAASFGALKLGYIRPNAEEENAYEGLPDTQQSESPKIQIPMEEVAPPCQIPDLQDDIRMVTTAKPSQYWLGRFSTLVSSLHHEDSFKEESDTYAGYGSANPPDHYYISTSPSATLDDQRAKRAFLFLENSCATAEARLSFLEFRDAYSKRCGDKWSKWFVGDATAYAAYKRHGSTSDLNSTTFLSVREMAVKKRKSSENGALGGIGLMNMFRTVRRSLA
ncbi:hypothetical protein AJ79_03566 [Helicocarpus griseus UAMH5409]|uniref:Uncharacterized protein n=1 Tax=Helicocarpus griseus UAMH5409 TaxID=1447875 RepID=A0A2B7XXQ9_9EURO|nr:hypothetical protein AJ79_03566 [Helicocarpus griseus UAMH5409]